MMEPNCSKGGNSKGPGIPKGNTEGRRMILYRDEVALDHWGVRIGKVR